MTLPLNPLPIVTTGIQPYHCSPSNSTDKTLSTVQKAVDEFFTSRQVEKTVSLGHAAVGLGYFTGVISPILFRPLALGFIFSSMILSCINICSASPKHASLKMPEIEKNWMDEFPSDSAHWDGKTIISFFSKLGLQLGQETLKIGLLVLKIGTFVAETILYPAFAIPRVCLKICAAERLMQVEKTVVQMDETVLKDLQKGRWNEYSSPKDFAMQAKAALARLQIHDPEKHQTMAKEYQSFLAQQPSLSRSDLALA